MRNEPQICNSYNTNILTISTTESLCPFNFTRITLQIEVLSALRSAKAEDLQRVKSLSYIQYFTIVSNKSDTMSWIDRT